MLIEIARKQRDFTPDPSFGTHFFQDLVEASIRYLPLYPDDRGITFNEQFLTTAKNILPDLLPDSADLGGCDPRNSHSGGDGWEGFTGIVECRSRGCAGKVDHAQ